MGNFPGKRLKRPFLNINAAQPTLATATKQAIKNGYPYFQLITSTPNGIKGDGEWFAQRWTNAVDSDLLFKPGDDGNEDWVDNADLIVNDPNKNSYPKVKFHWSEAPNKDKKWYDTQCQELDDPRLVNQELDLLFVGTSHCIISDEMISAMKPGVPKSRLDCLNGSFLDIYVDNIDPREYYIIGCDTAESLQGAFCAIQIYSFKDFKQVAELQAKFGSYTVYGQTIDKVFKWLYSQVGERIILSIENNTIFTSSFIQQCISNNFVNCWNVLRAL